MIPAYTDKQLVLLLEARMKGHKTPTFCPTCGRACQVLSETHDYGSSQAIEFIWWDCPQHCGRVAECSECGGYRCEVNDHRKSREILQNLCRCPPLFPDP